MATLQSKGDNLSPLLPHSWVLADSFDVIPLELLVPDHVHEAEPELAYVPCSACDGQGWLESYGTICPRVLAKNRWSHRVAMH